MGCGLGEGSEGAGEGASLGDQGEGRPGAAGSSAAGAPLRTEVGTCRATSREAQRLRGGAGTPPAGVATAKETTWLRGATSGCERASELRTSCALSPSPRWRRPRLAPRAPPTPPRQRCASALAASFRAFLRPNLVPQTLCFPFRGSSTERLRANQPPTPLLPDFSTSPPPEGVSAAGKRSRCGASLAAADHANRSSAPVAQTCPLGRALQLCGLLRCFESQ